MQKQKQGLCAAWVARGPGSRAGLGRMTAQVALRPGSARPGLAYATSPFLLLLFLFFLSFRIFFLLFLHFGSLIIIIFGLEIESQKLDFHVDVTWKKCHIRREQLIKIESQKLDLQTLNRVSQTRNASKKYSLETRTTNYIVRILWSFGYFGPKRALNNTFN